MTNIEGNDYDNCQMRAKQFVKSALIRSKRIEDFGGKRALGILLKSELCRKRSKFRI